MQASRLARARWRSSVNGHSTSARRVEGRERKAAGKRKGRSEEVSGMDSILISSQMCCCRRKVELTNAWNKSEWRSAKDVDGDRGVVLYMHPI